METMSRRKTESLVSAIGALEYYYNHMCKIPDPSCEHFISYDAGLVDEMLSAKDDLERMVRRRNRWRISRPCYDKMHRCPGWAGGGTRYARQQICFGGHLGDGIYYRKTWWLRLNRCKDCRLLVLPFAVRYVDWRFWQDSIVVRWWNVRRWYRYGGL